MKSFRNSIAAAFVLALVCEVDASPIRKVGLRGVEPIKVSTANGRALVRRHIGQDESNKDDSERIAKHTTSNKVAQRKLAETGWNSVTEMDSNGNVIVDFPESATVVDGLTSLEVTDDAFNTTVGTPVLITPLDNDIGAENFNFMVWPAGTALSQSKEDSDVYLFTPEKNFTGQYFLQYRACDSALDCLTGTVTVNVYDPSQEKVIIGSLNTSSTNASMTADDSYATSKDTLFAVPAEAGVLANDGPGLHVTVHTNGNTGSVIKMLGDGSFRYRPSTNFLGVDSFKYRACDSTDKCDESTVTITVIPAAAVADNSYATPKNSPKTIHLLTNDDSSMTLTVMNGPLNGTATVVANGSVAYIPNDDFLGSDMFTYEGCDQHGVCDVATVTISVSLTIDDIYTTVGGSELIVPVNKGILTNDYPGLKVTGHTNATNGTVTEMMADGAFKYSPNPKFVGSDTFSYMACASPNTCDEAVVTVFVTGLAAVPVAYDDKYVMSQNEARNGTLVISSPGILSNDVAVGGTNLFVRNNSDVSAGVVVVNSDGSFEYTPESNFAGEAFFSYVACDSELLCARATVTIMVTHPPFAFDDTYSTSKNTVLIITAESGIFKNDFDFDGDKWTLTVVDQPLIGNLNKISQDGAFAYTPFTDFSGTDVFTYKICDEWKYCHAAAVNITITGSDRPPTIEDISYEIGEDTILTFYTLENNDHVTLIGTSNGPSHGVLQPMGNGALKYTPSPDFFGLDTFDFVACNKSKSCGKATVAIMIGDVPELTADDQDSRPIEWIDFQTYTTSP